MTRLRAALASTLIAIGGPILNAPSASAWQTPTISPGDDIVTTAAGGAQQCTLGYTFTNPSTGIAYGITAGHCNSNRSSYVTDRTTGAIGHFVLTVTTPDKPLEDDYALIDFGNNRSVARMYGMPVSGITVPNSYGPVCHDGIRTGIACGQFHSRLFGSQLTTSDMPASIPGDSGGPVWQFDSTGGAMIIGIWLGEHLEQGASYGRYTGLTAVYDDIANHAGLNSRT